MVAFGAGGVSLGVVKDVSQIPLHPKVPLYSRLQMLIEHAEL